MIIIALDPGYDRCGIAVIERSDRGTERLVESTCILTKRTDLFEFRLRTVADEFRIWLDRYQPALCVLETLFFATNQKTAMRVAETRGALLLVACTQGVPIHEFTPKQVKIAVTGDGSASKKQVISMIPRLISLAHPIQYDDEYDAIAIALTASAMAPTLCNNLSNYPHKGGVA